MTTGQRTVTTMLAVVAPIGVILFLAGWGASDLVSTYRVIVTDNAGEARVLIGTHQGTGYLVVKDYAGKEVWGFRDGKPIGAASQPSPSQRPPATTLPPAAGKSRIVQLIGITPIEPDPAVLQRAAALEAEAGQHEADAKAYEFDFAALADKSSTVIRRITKKYGYSRSDFKNLKFYLRRNALESRKNAKRAQGEASKLRRETEAIRQTIRCWDGNHYIGLVGLRDFSYVLSQIPLRGYLTFKGRRRSISESDDAQAVAEVWEASQIKAATRPVAFVDAP